MAKPLFEDTMPIESQKPAFEDTSPLEAEEPSMAEKIETAARSALEGATFGVSEPAISGINAVVGNLISAGFNAEDVGEFVKQAASGEAIKQEYQRDIARRKALEAEMPDLRQLQKSGELLPHLLVQLVAVLQLLEKVLPQRLVELLRQLLR
jgi:hypothetical protein